MFATPGQASPMMFGMPAPTAPKDEIAEEFSRLRGKCTMADGSEVPMPPTNTSFESYMASVEPHWVALGRLLPGKEVFGAEDGIAFSQDHGQNTMTGMTGHPLRHRAPAAFKLIRNHEAVCRDVCNPMPTNAVGRELTQKHLKRVPVEHAQHVEEALRYVAIKLLGVTPPSGAPMLDTNNRTQCQVWAATAMFVTARLHLGDEKPGRNPDLPPDAGMAMRAALSEMGRETTGL